MCSLPSSSPVVLLNVWTTAPANDADQASVMRSPHSILETVSLVGPPRPALVMGQPKRSHKHSKETSMLTPVRSRTSQKHGGSSWTSACVPPLLVKRGPESG